MSGLRLFCVRQQLEWEVDHMKKKRTRHLSALLALVLSVGMLVTGFPVSAEEPSSAAAEAVTEAQGTTVDAPEKTAGDAEIITSGVSPDTSLEVISEQSPDSSEQAETEPQEENMDKSDAGTANTENATTESGVEQVEEQDYPAFTWSKEVAGNTVTIDAPESALPKDIKVEVTSVDADKMLNALKDATDDQELTADDVVAYDFDFYTDEEHHNIEPKKEITVSVKISDLDKDDEISAFHLNDADSEAKKEDVKSDPENGTVTLESDQFTIHAFVRRNAPEAISAIYLNGQNGDDSKDGTTAKNAVKTFAKAKELATENQNITTIYITGTVNVSGEVTLKGTNAVVKREASFNGYLMQVGNTATATFSDIRIDGNSEEATGTTKSLINSTGTLNIQDGTVLQNNTLTNLGYFQATGGAIHTDKGNGNSVINMTGGIIRNNTANYGGGIFLNYSTMNFSGGSIQNNAAIDGTSSAGKGYAAGGGITVYDGSTLNLSGNAEIKNNTSENIGGGISIGTGVGSNGADVLNMTGGTISGNSAGSGGGGILVQAGYTDKYGTANISGGTISDNRMTGEGTGNNAFGGGGIYVNGYSSWISGYHNGVLNLTNAVIKENTASMQGGGYASCPNSETHIYVKNGVALYANEAKSADEIYILASSAYGPHSGDPIYSIAPSMLGGTPYNWKYEDGSEVPLNKLDGQLLAINNESLSLHTDVGSDSNAESLAKVVITGNTSATRGAGIGSNGTVNMGEQDTIEIQVTKKWNDTGTGTLPEQITVRLYRNGSNTDKEPVYIGKETIKPDSEGNWKLTFTNLPKEDNAGNLYEYSVKEDPVDGFTAAVTGNQSDGFTITNTPIKRIDIPVEKIWKGGEGGSIQVTLLANGKEKETATITKEDGWKYTFKNLPETDSDGNDIEYTLSEVKIDGYTSSISGNAKDGFTITNKKNETPAPETTSVSVTKKWVGKTGDQAVVELYAGDEMVKTATLTEKEGWHHTFTDLDKKDSFGKEIKYSVKEKTISGWQSSVSGTAENGFVITNTWKESGKISIPVTKIWKGGTGEKAVIHLLADGEEVAAYELNRENNWQHTFTDLDKEKNGKEIQYSVTEDEVSGYNSSISGDAKEGFTVTNTKKPTTPTTPTNKTTGNPKTGDTSNMGLWLTLMLAALAGLVGNAVYLRKRR